MHAIDVTEARHHAGSADQSRFRRHAPGGSGEGKARPLQVATLTADPLLARKCPPATALAIVVQESASITANTGIGKGILHRILACLRWSFSSGSGVVCQLHYQLLPGQVATIGAKSCMTRRKNTATVHVPSKVQV